MLVGLFLAVASTACGGQPVHDRRGPYAEVSATFSLPTGSTSVPGTLHVSCGVGPVVVDGKEFVADLYGTPSSRPEGYADDEPGSWTRISTRQLYFRFEADLRKVWFRPPEDRFHSKPRCEA